MSLLNIKHTFLILFNYSKTYVIKSSQLISSTLSQTNNGFQNLFAIVNGEIIIKIT